MDKILFEIREAKINDASDILDLSEQLGYPNSVRATRQHLRSILDSNDHMIYVASVPDENPVALIHICKARSIQSGSLAEIIGLIVSKKFRGRGIGKKLLSAAEKWARREKLPKLRVRSNVEGEDAMKFYSDRDSLYQSSKESLKG